MSYIPTIWKDNETLIDAEKLNKIEQGIKDASKLAEKAATGEMLTRKPDLYLTETTPEADGLWVWFQPVRLRVIEEDPPSTDVEVADDKDVDDALDDVFGEDGVDYPEEDPPVTEVEIATDNEVDSSLDEVFGEDGTNYPEDEAPVTEVEVATDEDVENILNNIFGE